MTCTHYTGCAKRKVWSRLCILIIIIINYNYIITHTVPYNRPSLGTTRRWRCGRWAPKSADRWRATRSHTRPHRWPAPPPGPRCPPGTRPRPRTTGRVPHPSCAVLRSPRRASTAWSRRRPQQRLQTIRAEK